MGPLNGVRIVELDGIGPVPFCAMLLADMGADIVRIERPGKSPPSDDDYDLTLRGRSTVVLDLKSESGRTSALELIEIADVLLEGFRPGVMERLGLGPAIACARNPHLVYGRMTGWGQDGPLAKTAGHDLNYIAITGALHALGAPGSPPAPPLNLIGDYGGGALYLAMGVCAALVEARASGCGRVVDAAIIDGVTSLLTTFHGLRAKSQWRDERGANLLDGGAPFYRCYECADGRWVAIGAIEPQFYRALIQALGRADDPDLADQGDRNAWPLQRRKLAELFQTRPRDDWVKLTFGTDACLSPVLDWDEAPRNAQNVARSVFVTADDVLTGAAAPRFSGTVAAARTWMAGAPLAIGDVLRAWRSMVADAR